MCHLKDLPLGLYEKAMNNSLSWEQKLNLARDSGYDYVEVSIDATPERMGRLYNKEDAMELRAAIAKTSVPTYTMALTANRSYPLGSEDANVREKGIELVTRAVNYAAMVGIRVIHLAAYDEHGERCNSHTKQLFKQSLQQCVSYAAGKGVILALETMDTSFMGSCSNIMALCREIDSPFLQCYADIGNLTASNVDVAWDLATAKHHIVGVHLKDTRPGIYRDVLFGEGTVNFHACLQALKNIGYSGFMTAEMWSYDKDAFHPYLKKANQFLREKLRDY